jgi:hypothetical protein
MLLSETGYYGWISCCFPSLLVNFQSTSIRQAWLSRIPRSRRLHLVCSS